MTGLGEGADGVFDRVEYEYNRQGDTIQKKDQNGTVHAYEFDPFNPNASGETLSTPRTGIFLRRR